MFWFITQKESHTRKYYFIEITIDLYLIPTLNLGAG